jgi:succinate dehydrogenase hydrophobic anchor subunit
MRQTKGWTLHVIAGLALLLLLGIHMTTMHLDKVVGYGNEFADKKPVEWENVTARGQHLSMAGFYIVFLGFALFHAGFGTRTVILETDFGAKHKLWITKALIILGFGLFIFGSAAAIKFVAMSRAVIGG